MHPYECKVIKEGFQHALHPQNGFSLCPLFPKLIVYFLGALFETLPSENVIRRYDYVNTGSKYLVHRLTRAGTKTCYSTSYMFLPYIIRIEAIFFYSIYDGAHKRSIKKRL
jgi:hypothetical protein